jgi:hypothetical protein
MRTIAALAISVIASCAAAGLAIGVVLLFSPGPATIPVRMFSLLVGLIGALFLGWIIAIPLALIVGLPIHLFLSGQGLTKQKHYAIAGAAVGISLALLVVQRLSHTYGGNNLFAIGLAIGLTPGCITGAVAFRRTMDGRGVLPSFM